MDGGFFQALAQSADGCRLAARPDRSAIPFDRKLSFLCIFYEGLRNNVSVILTFNVHYATLRLKAKKQQEGVSKSRKGRRTHMAEQNHSSRFRSAALGGLLAVSTALTPLAAQAELSAEQVASYQQQIDQILQDYADSGCEHTVPPRDYTQWTSLGIVEYDLADISAHMHAVCNETVSAILTVGDDLGNRSDYETALPQVIAHFETLFEQHGVDARVFAHRNPNTVGSGIQYNIGELTYRSPEGEALLNMQEAVQAIPDVVEQYQIQQTFRGNLDLVSVDDTPSPTPGG